MPKLAAGKYLGAFCLTEQSSGSDAASLKSKAVAVKEGGQYRINGSKVFITNGGEADVFIVFASTDPQKGSKGISAFIVEKGTPGLIIGKDERKMGLHGSSTVQVTFEDMKVPAANLLGKEGEGFKIAMANLDAGRIGIAAQALGIAEGAMEHAVQYAKEQGAIRQTYCRTTRDWFQTGRNGNEHRSFKATGLSGGLFTLTGIEVAVKRRQWLSYSLRGRLSRWR